MTEPSYLESVRSAFCGIRSKFKTAIYVFGGDFNLPDIDWNKHTVTDSNYPHQVSKTFLDIAMDLQGPSWPRILGRSDFSLQEN